MAVVLIYLWQPETLAKSAVQLAVLAGTSTRTFLNVLVAQQDGAADLVLACSVSVTECKGNEVLKTKSDAAKKDLDTVVKLIEAEACTDELLKKNQDLLKKLTLAQHWLKLYERAAQSRALLKQEVIKVLPPKAAPSWSSDLHSHRGLVFKLFVWSF